jgi:hypothetical protein
MPRDRITPTEAVAYLAAYFRDHGDFSTVFWAMFNLHYATKSTSCLSMAITMLADEIDQLEGDENLKRHLEGCDPEDLRDAGAALNSPAVTNRIEQG